MSRKKMETQEPPQKSSNLRGDTEPSPVVPPAGGSGGTPHPLTLRLEPGDVLVLVPHPGSDPRLLMEQLPESLHGRVLIADVAHAYAVPVLEIEDSHVGDCRTCQSPQGEHADWCLEATGV